MVDYIIETNIEDKDLDDIKKLFLMTGEIHISPGDYVDIDNSQTLLSLAKVKIFQNIF